MSLRFLSSTWSFLLASTVIVQVQRYGSGLWKKSSLRFSKKSPHRWVVFSEKPCISSLAALERHLKRNDRCDRKTQKKCRERERRKGEDTRTSAAEPIVPLPFALRMGNNQKVFLKPMRKNVLLCCVSQSSLKSMIFPQTTYRPHRGLNRPHRNSKIF